MANSIQDLTQGALVGITLRPQTFSSTGAGLSVNVSNINSNTINCLLTVGAVNTLTSFVCKMQWSANDSDWTDIEGATFTSITAANQTQMINFLLPKAASVSASAPLYVRIYCTLTGTSVLATAIILAQKTYTGTESYTNAPPAIN